MYACIVCVCVCVCVCVRVCARACVCVAYVVIILLQTLMNVKITYITVTNLLNVQISLAISIVHAIWDIKEMELHVVSDKFIQWNAT